MDFRRPVEAVIPGVQGRILAVLAETTAQLNLRTLARLARASPAQVSRVLPHLVHAMVLTGNSVAVLEVSEADIAGSLNSKQPLWIDIAREGVVVHGPSLDGLRQRVSA